MNHRLLLQLRGPFRKSRAVRVARIRPGVRTTMIWRYGQRFRRYREALDQAKDETNAAALHETLA